MKKRIMALCFSLALLFSLAPSALAEPPAARKSNNMGGQNYGNWADPIQSYLLSGVNGILTRVENAGGVLVVETYDRNSKLQASREIPMELSKFGGFFAGENNYFFVFGQENTVQEDSKEVIRVVKYSKDWTRLGSVSLNGANTRIPFDAGSLRMAESNGILYVRTCHEMYTSSDGKNHQSNLTLAVDQTAMQIVDQFYEVMNSDYGYVSHSFNQFIQTVGDTLVALDHGDAYPRSVVLTVYPESKSISSGDCLSIDMLPIAGSVGDNYTGVTVGGFAATKSAYLAAGSAVVQDEQFKDYKTRNIFLSTLPTAGVKKDSIAQVQWLTSYTEGGTYSASTPQLAAVGDGTYVLMWQRMERSDSTGRYDYDGNTIEAIRLDAAGVPMGKAVQLSGTLSDCVPIAANGELVYYLTKDSVPRFYHLNPTTMKFTNKSADAGDLQNFTRIRAYQTGQFSDIAEQAWYANNVRIAYELGLMQGTGRGFSPDLRLSVGEALVMAARIHSTYSGDGELFLTSDNWYRPYVDYLLAEGVIASGFEDYTALCSRQIFVGILAGTIQKEALPTLRNSGAPFLDANAFSSPEFLTAANLLYGAGVISGVEATDGVRFHPQASITRAEAAAIISRMADPTLRNVA